MAADTHRIYILLLLLGKRSSERLFNTMNSPFEVFYERLENLKITETNQGKN